MSLPTFYSSPVGEILSPSRLKDLGMSSNVALFELRETFQFSYKGFLYEIPVGYITDFASIPRPLWTLLPPWHPRVIRPALVHDYGYNTKGMYEIAGRNEQRYFGTKNDVDVLFLNALAREGVSWITRHLMFNAVRLFAIPAWDRPSTL